MPDTHQNAFPETAEDALRLSLAERFRKVRGRTSEIAAPLSVEDLMVQSLPGGAPAKWHLAHTTWVFETLALVPFSPGYQPYDPAFLEIFAPRDDRFGPHLPGPALRLLSRPTATDVARYRDHVNGAVLHLIDRMESSTLSPMARAVAFGIEHERRHQERLLCDIKHAFWCNPTRPAYMPAPPLAAPDGERPPCPWFDHDGGLVEIGRPDDVPGRDHETPRHTVHLRPFRLAGLPVTCGEYRAFIEDGGYETPDLWLADGWEAARSQGWRAPLYWERLGGDWHIFTLYGMRPLDPTEPVCHVSFYEADAYARWVGKRLPTEVEWEVVGNRAECQGNLLGNGQRHPQPAGCLGSGPWQMFGDLWEWTGSALRPYPGYRAPDAPWQSLSGRFMTNRMVLKGGSCVTSADVAGPATRHHLRPATRWAFTGLRLAEDR